MNKILITGGCGFIGTNAALHFLKKGYQVISIDNLSRPGVRNNLDILKQSGNFINYDIDIASAEVETIFRKYTPCPVLHLAAQVAVTLSIRDPRKDFSSNAFGTLNLLEFHRKYNHESAFINVSTNKVYGKLTGHPVSELGDRYIFADRNFSAVSEHEPLMFDSPYGCSKGAADQYAIDYATTFGLKTVTLRQSCIYGKFQYGLEDQGWVAWFLISCMLNRTLNIFGTGKQVRDVLYCDDLIRLYDALVSQPESLAGQVYNVGGGANNTLSLLECVREIEEICEKKVNLQFSDHRKGDQPIYISDIQSVQSEWGWSPQVNPQNGMQLLFSWLREHKETLKKVLQ